MSTVPTPFSQESIKTLSDQSLKANLEYFTQVKSAFELHVHTSELRRQELISELKRRELDVV